MNAEILPNPDVLLTELADGTGVLLHLETKFYYALNATGVFVWRNLVAAPGAHLSHLAQQVSESFEVDGARAEEDLRTLMGELVAERLVVERAARNGG